MKDDLIGAILLIVLAFAFVVGIPIIAYQTTANIVATNAIQSSAVVSPYQSLKHVSVAWSRSVYDPQTATTVVYGTLYNTSAFYAVPVQRSAFLWSHSGVSQAPETSWSVITVPIEGTEELTIDLSGKPTGALTFGDHSQPVPR
ncbi:hypothetical protein TPY_2740 [Sulfobacillus acidophilus TPY]|uniref:Uncharacterized protein n=1 Tax=Sulfobacillus acidophilus (strain ATCC 700253 / DSM 10332 / NAL) TaxID=679936 RepID=G8TUJ4_SULAD|nr:hypothetical protein TPY_2740 [Sulfobacillus acidophilus TPY]AEW04641.1 hypothetical protein Sulac_1141 [Sulfobacillus acidophilus DSM 10332]